MKEFFLIGRINPKGARQYRIQGEITSNIFAFRPIAHADYKGRYVYNICLVASLLYCKTDVNCLLTSANVEDVEVLRGKFIDSKKAGISIYKSFKK